MVWKLNLKNVVKRLLAEKENRRYEKLLRSRQGSYQDWITALERKQEADGEPCEVRQVGKAQSCKEQVGKAQDGKAQERQTADGEAGQSGLTGCRETMEDGCEYVVIRAGEGRFAAGFCEVVRSCFAAHPEVFILYGDEDVGSGGQGESGIAASERYAPWFKPDWSPDLLESFFYFGSVVVLRAELFHRAAGIQGQETNPDRQQAAGRQEAAFDGQIAAGQQETNPDRQKAAGAQEAASAGQSAAFARRDRKTERGMAFYVVTDFSAYEMWIHGLVELAGGYEPGSRVVGHAAIPWFTADSPESRNRYLETSPFLRKRQALLLQKFRQSSSPGNPALLENVSVKNVPVVSVMENVLVENAPVVSIVILSKDHPEILGECLKGCVLGAGGQTGAGLSWEIILVDNGSSEENRRQVEALAQEFTLDGGRIAYLYRPQPFHFSRLCNLGASQAGGKLLLFLNDDVMLCEPGCMEVLAALAERPQTGAVGMKLYYPDSVRIQHAGITNLPMGPVHKLQFLEDNKNYYYGANRGRHNVLAVTAACLMVEKKKYLEAGGFAEELPVAFNDVDFCFRLYELGYQNVCVNDMYGYHCESLSRGGDETPKKLARLLRERDRLYEMHPLLEGTDPYYSLHLNREGLDVSIRPAYLTAGNTVQRVRGRLAAVSVEGIRIDACLMVRVEDCRNRKAVGYGVVLGDNNACYDKMLLMEQISDGNGGTEEGKKTAKVYAVKLAGQYRPDLEENMPDQEKVGLCGFMVELEKGTVPEGRYRLGMEARNRVTGLRIVNWSNRMVEL